MKFIISLLLMISFSSFSYEYQPTLGRVFINGTYHTVRIPNINESNLFIHYCEDGTTDHYFDYDINEYESGKMWIDNYGSYTLNFIRTISTAIRCELRSFQSGSVTMVFTNNFSNKEIFVIYKKDQRTGVKRDAQIIIDDANFDFDIRHSTSEL